MRAINNHKEKIKRLELRKNQTIHESKLWSILRNSKTGYKWRRQVSIGPYIADFYCREKQIAVEIDGSQHNNAKEYDTIRQNYFNELGIRTLRFWNNEIDNLLDSVHMKIISELENTVAQDSQERFPAWENKPHP